MVGTLTQASLFLSMLMRASAAFPRELSPRDRAVHAAVQSAVAELEQATGQALQQARDAVLGMTARWHVSQGTHTHGKAATLPVAPVNGDDGGVRHWRWKTRAAAVVSPSSAQAYALLRLAEQYASLKDFIDSFWAQYIETKRAQKDTDLVSAEFILAVSGMLFSIEALGQSLLKVGSALRELVERERLNAYAL